MVVKRWFLLHIFPVRPIILKSTGPVLDKFAGLAMAVDHQAEINFSVAQVKGRCPGNQFLLVLSRELSSDPQNWVSEFRGDIRQMAVAYERIIACGSLDAGWGSVRGWMDSQVGDSWAGYSYGFAVHLVLLRSEIVAMKGVCVCLWCRRLTHGDTAAAAAATRGHTDRVPSLITLIWTATLDLYIDTRRWLSVPSELLSWFMQTQTIKVKGHLVQQLEWKQTVGRTRPVTLPFAVGKQAE